GLCGRARGRLYRSHGTCADEREALQAARRGGQELPRLQGRRCQAHPNRRQGWRGSAAQDARLRRIAAHGKDHLLRARSPGGDRGRSEQAQQLDKGSASQSAMAASTDTHSMALFCDFENIALGVKDAKYDKFDIAKVLERLLVKGSIVVKKAYCDWDRYKDFKAAMHEAAFELIEIPHVRQSGKNSADIRMVVDALDLCYTKSHVDTFVIISG